MNNTWQIQDAKNKLSEVITRAQRRGPQTITKHGKKAVVVLAYSEYEKLKKSQVGIVEFFASSPLAGIDLTRDKSLPRDAFKL